MRRRSGAGRKARDRGEMPAFFTGLVGCVVKKEGMGRRIKNRKLCGRQVLRRASPNEYGRINHHQSENPGALVNNSAFFAASV